LAPTPARGNRPDIDLAVIATIANLEPHERRRLPYPAYLETGCLRSLLERIGEPLHRRGVVRAGEIVQVACRTLKQVVRGHRRTARQHESSRLG
jgi:hypothetical protein